MSRRVRNDITDRYLGGRPIGIPDTDAAFRAVIEQRAAAAHERGDVAEVRAYAVMVDLLDRIDGYKQVVQKLGENPASNGVDTSDDAGRTLKKSLSAKRFKVLSAIARLGTATSDDVEAATLESHQTVSTRFLELREFGWIERTGDKRDTRKGNKAHVHRVTDEGRRVLAEHAARGGGTPGG